MLAIGNEKSVDIVFTHCIISRYKVSASLVHYVIDCSRFCNGLSNKDAKQLA